MDSAPRYRIGLCAFTVAASLGIASTAPAAVLTHWDFNETSGNTVADSSGNTYNGTIQDATGVTHTSGVFGEGLTFNGTANAYVSTPYVAGFQSSSFTMSAWVNVTASGLNTIFSDWSKNSWSFRFFVGADGKLCLDLRGPDAQPASAILNKNTVSTTAISYDTWHQVAAVWDRTSNTSGTLTYYIDGVAAGTFNAKAGLSTVDLRNNTGNNYGIGIKQDDTTRFNGSLDELWVFNTALSADEVKSLYQFNSIAAIPEPAAAGMMLLGAAALGCRRRR